MAMTLEIVSQRVEALEKQLAILMANTNNNTNTDDTPTKKVKPEKKPKKEKKDKSSDEDEKPKAKRISGYILYSQAMREDVKNDLQATAGEEKLKSTDIMKELGRLWKALDDDEREQWNTKAAEMKADAVDA
jgi:hypothetical protein